MWMLWIRGKWAHGRRRSERCLLAEMGGVRFTVSGVDIAMVCVGWTSPGKDRKRRRRGVMDWDGLGG